MSDNVSAYLSVYRELTAKREQIRENLGSTLAEYEQARQSVEAAHAKLTPAERVGIVRPSSLAMREYLEVMRLLDADHFTEASRQVIVDHADDPEFLSGVSLARGSELQA